MLRVLGLVALAAAPLVAAAANSASTCDRACLISVLDRYLHSVIEHDPARGPLAGSYRETQNAVNFPSGEGIWRTATALGPVERRYADPVSGEVAYYGILQESGKAVIVTVRLRVERREVTEAEWYVARDGDPGLPGGKPPNAWNPPGLIANPPPERTIPAGERLPRATMIAIANTYYDGIVSHNGKVTLAHAGCNRFENGTRVTVSRGGRSVDCVSGLEHFNLANVGGRRIPLVDEEAGVVLGLGVFIRRPGSPVPRNAFSEWFWIDGGKIRNIWTAMFYPGPELPVPNWPPYDGNFPLPANTVPAAPAAH
ncbi:MAG TPA: hypothetical protein VGI35_08160 [Steroidobacteraceae bacterium]|jgi:hypothetical protein